MFRCFCSVWALLAWHLLCAGKLWYKPCYRDYATIPFCWKQRIHTKVWRENSSLMFCSVWLLTDSTALSWTDAAQFMYWWYHYLFHSDPRHSEWECPVQLLLCMPSSASWAELVGTRINKTTQFCSWQFFFFVLKWCVLWAGELSALAPQHKINLKHCVCWNSSEPATTLGSLTLVFELVKPHCVLAAWALWRLVRLAICSLLNDKHFRVSSPFLLNKRDDPQHWYPNSFYIIMSLFPFLKVNVN